ncbi:MAG TPA: hypothetical protein VLA96_04845 [Terriglobales bacterium]|nr:hypothetical protein [Terriglobales bacterium]
MKGHVLAIVMFVVLVVLVAAGTVHSARFTPARTPESAVRSLFEKVKSNDLAGAYTYVSPSANVDQQTFTKDINGRDGSLRTYSKIESVETKVLRSDDNQATVRATTKWSTAVGPMFDTRDLKVAKEGSDWKVLWESEKQANLPPQVIPVNYLRWDIIRRGADEDWGAQNVESPRIRILSMNAVEKDGSVVIMGEVRNEDTVPGFVSVGATLLGKDGKTLGEETSFDKVSHTLLPSEISPYRIDFPKTKLSDVQSVRMQPASLLIPASADPVIGVLHQRLEKDASGRTVLRGELVNQSGQTVNIPHVLATYYDDAGRVIWVSDAYSDKALLPQTPVPFSVDVRDDLAANVHSYRVTVNQYSIDRVQ